jgi:MFS family permease
VNEPATALPRAYFIAQGFHFAAGGLMGVLFPWLIAQVLHESDARVGLAQFFATLPLMFLVLVGGAAADGRDLRAYLARLQLSAAMVPILLALIIALGQLTFVTAMVCMVALGCFAAFIMPARDALLSYVTPPAIGLARTAALAVAATFGGQLVGTAIAASAATIGPVPLLSLQAVLLALAGMLSARVPLLNPQAFAQATPAKFSRLLHEMLEGLKAVRRSERLRTVILYLALAGPLFNGMFLVGFPLLVRDVYHGSSAMLASLIGVFLLGLTLSSFAMGRMKPVERQGRLMMLLSLNNIFVFALAHLALPFPLFMALIFVWGLSAGANMAVNRGMIQAAAPPLYRARVLSVLQFSQIAGGPPGALLYGFVSQAVGILNTLLIVPAVVAALWLIFRYFTRLWDFRREDAMAETTAPLALD